MICFIFDYSGPIEREGPRASGDYPKCQESKSDGFKVNTLFKLPNSHGFIDIFVGLRSKLNIPLRSFRIIKSDKIKTDCLQMLLIIWTVCVCLSVPWSRRKSPWHPL